MNKYYNRRYLTENSLNKIYSFQCFQKIRFFSNSTINLNKKENKEIKKNQSTKVNPNTPLTERIYIPPSRLMKKDSILDMKKKKNKTPRETYKITKQRIENINKMNAAENLKDILKDNFRIVASTIVYRDPVVITYSDIEKEYFNWFEKRGEKMEEIREKKYLKRLEEYYKLTEKKQKTKDKTKAKSGNIKEQEQQEQQQQQLLVPEEKMEQSLNEKENKIKEVLMFEYPYVKDIYPFITPADEANDRKSLYRKLDKFLYLIVKKPRESYAWQFPQGSWEEIDGFHLRNTAERELQEECGQSLETHFLGHLPCAVWAYQFKEPEIQKKYGNVLGTKVFYYFSKYIDGTIKLNNEELVDYLWVTKNELKEYLDPEFYNYISKILRDAI